MKQTLLYLFLISSGYAVAQPLKLSKGKSVTITTTSSQDMDMGSGIQIKNSSQSVNAVTVTGVDDKNYMVTSVLTKLVISADMMGQQQNYDSNVEADKDSPIGKSVAEKINKPVILLIDKESGDIVKNEKKELSKDSINDNPLIAMLQSTEGGGDEAVVKDMYFIIPPGKKTGDAWVDTATNKDIKSKRTFTLKSVANNTATIGLVSEVYGTTTMEMQGMSFDVTINSKTIGELLVDTKTSLVQKRDNNADITGNIDIMGQSTPITAKATLRTEYKYL